MNYQKIYNQLVQKRQKTPAIGYTEKHHIIPKSLGGSDSLSNIVVLTAREHFIAHRLLYKIHKTKEMAYAWNMMRTVSSSQKRKIKISSHTFAQLRQALSTEQLGAKNHRYGKKNSEKHTQAIRKGCAEKNTKKVRCIETNIIYNSIIEATAAAGLKNSANIVAVCKGNRSKAGGYSWEYVNSHLAEMYSKKPYKPRGESNKKPVLCVETGQTFDSAEEASKWCNAKISRACTGERQKAGGYTWKYI